MDLRAQGGVAQGMVLASPIGGFALAVIGQIVSAFPGDGHADRGGPAGRAVVRFALAATVMMINVWTGIVYFQGGGGRRAIAAAFYGGLLVGVLLAALGMTEMGAIRSPRLRRPILAMFGALLAAELALARAFLRRGGGLRPARRRSGGRR